MLWIVGRSGSLEAEKRPGPGAHNAPAPSRQQVEHAQATAATTCAPATQILPHHPKPSAPQRAGHRPAVRGRLPRREPVRPAAAPPARRGGGALGRLALRRLDARLLRHHHPANLRPPLRNGNIFWWNSLIGVWAVQAMMSDNLQELDVLSIKELRERAGQLGVAESLVDAARDSDDSRTQLITLIRAAATPAPAPKPESAPLVPVQPQEIGTTNNKDIMLVKALAGAALGISTITFILVLVLVVQLHSVGKAAEEMREEMKDSLSAPKLMSDFVSSTLDEGRIHATLTSAASFATTASTIDWKLQTSDDPALSADMEIDQEGSDDMREIITDTKSIITSILSGMSSELTGPTTPALNLHEWLKYLFENE
jgi:hypothetical protein